MAIFRDSDGTEIRLPPGSTPADAEQVFALRRQQADVPQQPGPAQAQRSLGQRAGQAGIDALIGLGSAAAEPVLGLGQLGTMAGEKLGIPGSSAARADLEDRARTIRGMREEAGGWGTAGEIAGFAAGGLATLPGKVGMMLPKALGKLPSILQPAARGAALGATEQGIYEAARPVLDDDPSRGERALQGAAFGGAGGGAGGALPQALSRLAEPIRATPEARQVANWMRGRGIEPQMTTGQAAGAGSLTGAFEEATAGLPVIGKAVDRARGRGVEAWDQAMLADIAQTASGRVTPLRGQGPEAVAQAQQMVRDAYTQGVAGRQLQIAPDDFTDSLNALQRLPPSSAPDAESLLNMVASDVASGNVTGDAVIRLRSTISEAASKAYRDGDYALGRALDQIRIDYQTVLERGAAPEQLEALRRADKSYGKLVDYQTAAATQGALTQGGMVAPNQLISAMRRGEPASQLASSKTPGLREAQQAQEVFGSALPRPGPGTAEKLMAAGVLGGGGAALAAGVDPMAVGIPMAAVGLLGTRAGRRALVPGIGGSGFDRGRVALADALRSPRLQDVISSGASRFGALYGQDY